MILKCINTIANDSQLQTYEMALSMSEATDSPALSLTRWSELAREVIAGAAHLGIQPIGHTGFLMEQRRLREGLVEALSHDGEVASVFAQVLHREFPAISPENAHETACQLLLRRAAEQQAFHTALTQDRRFLFPDLLAQAKLEPHANPAGKFVRMLTLQERAEGPESITHILFQADGQRRGHAALQTCWEPGGAVHRTLQSALRRLLPDVRPEAVDFTADYFIRQRHARAAQATQDMDQDSPVVQRAKQISHRTDPAVTLKPRAAALPFTMQAMERISAISSFLR